MPLLSLPDFFVSASLTQTVIPVRSGTGVQAGLTHLINTQKRVNFIGSAIAYISQQQRK